MGMACEKNDPRRRGGVVNCDLNTFGLLETFEVRVSTKVVILNFEGAAREDGTERKRQQCGGIMHGNCDATTTGGVGRQTFPQYNRVLGVFISNLDN